MRRFGCPAKRSDRFRGRPKLRTGPLATQAARRRQPPHGSATTTAEIGIAAALLDPAQSNRDPGEAHLTDLDDERKRHSGPTHGTRCIGTTSRSASSPSVGAQAPSLSQRGRSGSPWSRVLPQLRPRSAAAREGRALSGRRARLRRPHQASRRPQRRRPHPGEGEARGSRTRRSQRVSSCMEGSSRGRRCRSGLPRSSLGGIARVASAQLRVVSESMATVIARMSGASSPAATSTP